MFGRKKQNKYEQKRIVTEVSLPTLARWYAYDSGLEDPNNITNALGMLPTSDEGTHLEESESDKRLEKVLPLIPLLECIADINAQAVAGLQFDDLIKQKSLDKDDLAHEREHVEEMYRHVGFSALLSALSAGVELGVIEANATEGKIVYVE